jgi:hypothetical protein
MQSLHTILSGKAVNMVRLAGQASGMAAFVAFASFASAATTINVDFNNGNGAYPTYSGEAAAPASGGTTWNGFNIGSGGGIVSTTSAPLVTSTGSATNVTVTLGNYNTYVASENPAVLAPNLMTNFAYQPVLGPGGANSTFSINNLNPASSYDIYIYSQNAGYSETATIFTIGGVSKTATNTGGTTGGPNSFTLNGNYVLYSGITPNGAGTISGLFNDFKPADNAAFNGLQIVLAVPEPSVLPLVGLASGLLLRRRRRS